MNRQQENKATEMTGEDSNGRKSALQTVLLLGGVTIVVGVLFSVYGLLGVPPGLTAFGSLFLLYWAGLQKQVAAEFLPSLLGGLAGIALGWVLVVGPVLWGPPAAIFAFALLACTLFAYLRGDAHFIVNSATMMNLVLATIPELRLRDNVLVIAESLIVGAAYIGLVTMMAGRVRARIARAANSSYKQA